MRKPRAVLLRLGRLFRVLGVAARTPTAQCSWNLVWQHLKKSQHTFQPVMSSRYKKYWHENRSS